MRRLVAAPVLAAAALLAAGCGTGGISEGKADTAHGKQLFQEKCGSCHTLADAGTQGKIGPNLDDAFASDRKQGYKQVTIQQIVKDQIELASGAMPPNLLTGQNALDVAAYVASVAGVPGKGSGPLTSGKDIFVANCGSCHTLGAAGTTGTVGPNLDQLKPAFARIQTQVINGGTIMPAFKGKLTPTQIKTVSMYVASNAGKH